MNPAEVASATGIRKITKKKQILASATDAPRTDYIFGIGMVNAARTSRFITTLQDQTPNDIK